MSTVPTSAVECIDWPERVLWLYMIGQLDEGRRYSWPRSLPLGCLAAWQWVDRTGTPA